MDIQKGLFRNGSPVQQPPGSYPFGKNGVGFEQLGALVNEPGFAKFPQALPGPVVGVVPTDSMPVLLLLVNGQLQLHKMDPQTRSTALVLNLSALADAPAFSLDDYFTGEAERNYKGDLVVALTNKRHRPLYVNCDDITGYSSFKDLYLIPLLTPPTVAASVVPGGILAEGTYFPFVAYEMADGARTHFVFTGLSPLVGRESDNRLLQLEFTGLDTRYDFVTVGILHRSNGVTKAFKLAPQAITGAAMRWSLTGAEVKLDLLPEELLAIPPDYIRAGAIGQLNGELYLGDLEVDETIDYQQYATKVKVEWTSELMDLTAVPDEHAQGLERSMMPQEVYGLYIRLWTTSGRPSRWFHIPGVKPTAAQLQALTLGNVTAPAYKLQDTIGAFSAANKRGDTGVWVNESETYPNHEAFNATAIGGEDLRGQKVRHHRMPSLAWLKTNLYAAEGDYGRTKLDRLGLRISNVTLPAALTGRVSHYEVGFAQRSVANSTVLGVSPLLYGATDPASANPNTVVSTGGNWNGGLKRSNGDQDTPHVLNRKYFRLHPMEVLQYRPKAALWALFPQLGLRAQSVAITEVDDGVQDGNDIPCSITVDYTNGANLLTALPNAPLAVKESFFVRNHTTRGVYNNALTEGAWIGELEATGPVINVGQSTFPHAGSNYYSKPAYEETILVSALMDRSDLYESFTQQQVIPCGALTAPGTVAQPAAGDAFCIVYTFHTYGRDLRDSSENAYFDPVLGLRVARRIATVSSCNHHLRYEDPANLYSRFWPLSPLASGAQDNYLTLMNQSQDPNQFGYNRDFNSLFDLDPGGVFDPYNPEQVRFPYRIHRFGKTQAGNRFRSWRNLLALDYYELARHLGRVVNIDGDENLLIHMEHALLITRDKAKLTTGPLSVTLGSGDIFQFEPQEGLSAPLGYAGTRHDLACVRCPLGYLFVDAQSGDIFLYKGGLKSLAGGLSNFLRDYLKVEGRNPFRGNGITIGFDPHFKRVLLTVKNQRITSGLEHEVKNFDGSVGAYNALVPNKSVVYRNGRYMIYRGVNNPAITGVDCPPEAPIVGTAASTSIKENPFAGADIYTVTTMFAGGSSLVYAIVAGNGLGGFQINAATGKVTVANPAVLDFETNPTFALTIEATGACGAKGQAVLTVNLGDVNEDAPGGGLEELIDVHLDIQYYPDEIHGQRATIRAYIVGSDGQVFPDTMRITGNALRTAGTYASVSFELFLEAGTNMTAEEDLLFGSGWVVQDIPTYTAEDGSPYPLTNINLTY